MVKKLTPEDLYDIFVKLQAAELDAVVVGGQAINLWASKYRDRSPQLQQMLPFASEDLDFYGGKIEVLTCQEALQGEAKLNRDFDPSPNSGIVTVKRQDVNLRIDFLASVYGLNDSEITGTAIPFPGESKLSGVNIKVLHPILCLEGKLKSLRGLPQQGRQDKKHVEMAILCVKEFVKDLCNQEQPRTGLKLVERMLDSALKEDGLNAWYRHGIQVESAIPIEELRQLNDEKWQKFYNIILPKVLEQIHVKRNRYLEAMEQSATRSKNLEQKRQTSTSQSTDTELEQPQTLPPNALTASPTDPIQLTLAAATAPTLIQCFLTLKNHQQTQELDTGIEMAEGENYQLLLNRQANIFSVIAKDGRGELMRVNVTTGKILYATGITGSDLERWQAIGSASVGQQPAPQLDRD
ncbi:MAG: hypothetical protein CLLPBCKN_007531 [Chroococcidiopsis cubana SAG 39.79]|uniref:DUF4388 domain-containing protein n=1 Tax=Chroococcidiopsis cubana SAG 39.79 TaxID=388085 RepID=A0AB37UUB6_9CYAN|nr:hypothetical protein [Chroococcidiopsis cubana]MDZ4878096.1 hypothetical protein [Chroococcidiopsis cubana SAG 39.79]PSB65439.1 hypothetical protein C7B79_05460 [Chroococcidiopsis cubana CCALA 043]RUT14627.1 hypothetical protein DSM107010_01730 [Chroococcidiopsis cubana SAG 39.79]